MRKHLNWLRRRGRGRTACVAAVIALVPAAAFLTVSMATSAGATTVPAPPSGWTTTYSDTFSGAAGLAAWTPAGPTILGTQYSGTGCTGQLGYRRGREQHQLDRQRLRGRERPPEHHRRWTRAVPGPRAGSRRSATTSRPRRAARWRSAPRSSSPTRPAALATGRRSGCSARASGPAARARPGRWTARTGRPPARSTSWRTSTRCPSTPARFHCGVDPGGPCNETTGLGSGLQSCSGCQTGYNTYSVIVNRTDTSNESITLYLNGTRVLHRHREPGRHVHLAGRGRPRVLPDPGSGHRRRLPERRLRLQLTYERDQFRRGDERRVRGRVPDQRLRLLPHAHAQHLLRHRPRASTPS